MRCIQVLVLAITWLPLVSFGSTDMQADSFANIYASTCLKHLSRLDELREKLKSVPALPPERAAKFLNGTQGKAWPVPDKHGTFVVAVPDGKNSCSVFARRVEASAAIERFDRLVKQAPSPLKTRLIQDQAGSVGSKARRTVAYEWFLDGAQRRMQFVLTTSTDANADIQGLATASLAQ